MVKKIKEKGEKKRKIIRDHAKNELVIHGVNSLSLRKISADLGISHGNLHYYFKTKDHLLLDIFNEEINKLNKSIGNNSPIIDTVYGILFLNKSPKKSFQKLSKKLT